MFTNYTELYEQTKECVVNILQFTDNPSQMDSPEFNQRAPTDKFIQLNIYRIQIQEQSTIINHSYRSIFKNVLNNYEKIFFL